MTPDNNVSRLNILPFSSCLASTALGMPHIHTGRRVSPRRISGHYLGGASKEDRPVKSTKCGAATQD